ncbi:MAG: hypothetical protein HW421_1067 [Ignavibacteria bacterium]|nr:hypothetical protein [Ignavibacteria bacterium]
MKNRTRIEITESAKLISLESLIYQNNVWNNKHSEEFTEDLCKELLKIPTNFKDIIDTYILNNNKEEIKEGIRRAVKEVNLIKKGKMKARPARELINEL